MRIRDIDFRDILSNEKKYKNILIHDISCKFCMGPKPLRIRFDEIDGFIKICDGIRYLLFFWYLWYGEIYDRFRYLISEKSSITNSINHNFARIRVDSYNSLPIEKILTFHNVITLIKPVVNYNENNYYYNIFLEKDLYKGKSNSQYF